MTRLTQTTKSAAVATVEQFVQRQNWVTLIKLTAAGDESAFAQLYKSTSGLLFGLLLRILGHSETAEEVLEEVYADVWKQAGEFDGKQEKLLTWLITIAHCRAVARLGDVPGCSPVTNRENDINNRLINVFDCHANLSEPQRLLRSAIDALSPAQREILELAYFSGMKESEIAVYLGQSPETVVLSLRLARKKLHTLFSFLDKPQAASNEFNRYYEAAHRY